jgi:hypothetical protein
MGDGAGGGAGFDAQGRCLRRAGSGVRKEGRKEEVLFLKKKAGRPRNQKGFF